ncbi:SDR family NAD(P)-dependent oxidoreductase [Capnocytophaga canis]|uniref:SDR family NAD(P)-dependent oxidoreductase n=1 Tax=Capnocytophaga canis TaxID=1848903 RepID=UPI00217557DF|nr:SDR family NAD(P)-dependent oxidoreductase [Capnocytophaga canis]
MKLSNNTILITGGSSGIGWALAERFYELDNKVIITGRDPKKLAQIKSQYPNIQTFARTIFGRRNRRTSLFFTQSF